MHFRCSLLVLPLLLSCRPSQAPVQDVQAVAPPAVATPSAVLPSFTRGINLGNALDAPSEGAWGVRLSEAHFAMAHAAGLDHVRLPVRFSAHASASAPFTIDEGFFKRVDWAIDQALAHGLAVIVDLHHYEELMKEPEANSDRFVGLWSQIAARYKDRPQSVAFELANEPCDKLTPELLNGIHARALKVVRATNPTRTVIVDSYFWAGADYLKQLELPEDPNLVASFHMYQPILFTHQGAPWMAPEFQTSGLVFPGPPSKPIEPVAAAQSTPWVAKWFEGYNTQPIATNPNGPQAIFDYFKTVEDYVASSKRRVYLGEFGALDSADPKSRENWVHLVRTEAERRHIGWAYWDDGGRFKAMDVSHASWVPNLQRALFD